MMTVIHRLDPFDRQVILLYLEGLDAAAARRLRQPVARRNLRESAAAVIVIGFYGGAMWIGPSVAIRVGAALIIAEIRSNMANRRAWGVVAAGGMVGGHLFNRRAAAAIQRRIDSLRQ
jgi:hypothetical protein